MKLREFLLDAKKIVEKNPDALDMEMFATHGASGETNEVGSIHISKIDEEDDWFVMESVPRDYPHKKYIWIYIGN